jgi:DNA-binding transcriptional LysR family regulator
VTSRALTVAIVVGVTPDKWVRRWRERFSEHPLEVIVVDDEDQVAVLRDGRARMAFVRLPVDRAGLHLIPLWSEVEVAVLSRDHPLAEFDALERADLDEEIVLEGLAPKAAVETVAAGTGMVFLPMSVARAHHRKDVVAVPVTDLPETRVGLAWRIDDEDPVLEQFIGIVRGRTERSSRGSTPSAAPRQKAPARKNPARQSPRRRR